MTLTLADYFIFFLMNSALAIALIFIVNFTKRNAELSAEERSNDKEYLKKVIREAVSEARNVLTELRVHEFETPTGRRRLARINSLVEKISLVDEKLGSKIWELVNVPVLISVYKQIGSPEAESNFLELRRKSFKDLEWALQRCAKIEKNPTNN